MCVCVCVLCRNQFFVRSTREDVVKRATGVVGIRTYAKNTSPVFQTQPKQVCWTKFRTLPTVFSKKNSCTGSCRAYELSFYKVSILILTFNINTIFLNLDLLKREGVEMVGFLVLLHNLKNVISIFQYI